MTITFQPNELERKCDDFFKSYNFFLEKNLDVYKLDKETFFDLEKSIFGIECKYFTQAQKNIIYTAYAKACEDEMMKNCKKEIVDALKKYNCYLDTNEKGEMLIGNSIIDRFILI